MYMKKVIGAASVITVIMVVVLIAFSSTVSANAVEKTFTKEGGVIAYSGTRPRDADAETKIITVYEGERIKFMNETNASVAVTVSGPYDHDGDKKAGCADYSVRAGESWDSDGMKTGYFFGAYDTGGNGCWFGVDKQFFRLKLVDDIDKVREKESFNLTLKKNNKKGGVMKLTIEDNEGYSIMNANGIDIYEALVNYTQREFTSDPVDADGNPVDGIKHDAEGKLVFNTAQLDMRKGKYKIILEDYATEVEDDVTITVEKWYLEMECSDEVVKGWEDIVITIHSSFYEQEVNITVEGIPEWEEKTLTLDEEGKKKIRIPTENVDYGRYKVTAKVFKFPACAETRYVLIKKGKTSLEVPETATVGDIVHLKGTSDYGYLAVFVIDEVYKSDAAIIDDKFGWNWDTSGELEGGKEIEVFILNEHVPFSIGDNISKNWQREEGVDAAAIIFLFPPTLSMTLPKRIADSDDVVISGKATGTDRVYIIAINKEGDVVFPPDGIARATPAEESKWGENIGELDSGNYTVISLHKGKDGRTNTIENGKWAAGGENKTLEERVAIFMDAIRSAGSDDLFVLFNFTVEPAYVSFNPIENVTIGEPLEITGKTNREPGTWIWIWTIEGPALLPAVITEVEWPTADEGVFSATIDTTGAVSGKYTLKADDIDGNNGTAIVELASPPPANVSIIKLNPMEDVVAGEHLVVSGTTIWGDRHWIIVTVKGLTELPAVMVEVENGTFCAIFDTASALTGPYTVKADDGCGHTNEAIVNITLVPNGAFSSVIITDVKPTELHSGDTKEVILTVKNNGGRDARDVRLIFEGTRNVSVTGSTVVQINTLNSWCSKEVKITVHVEDGTPNGVYSMPVMCFWNEYYFDPVEGYVSKPRHWPVYFGISINVMGCVIINVGNVYTEPTHVRPGDEDVRVIVSIENSGEADAKDVEAKLICDEQFKPSWSGTDRVYIGRLNSGYAAKAIFHVDIADNMDAGTYSIPLVIRFKDTENVEYRGVMSIDILVERKPELESVSYYAYAEPVNISGGDVSIDATDVRGKILASEQGNMTNIEKIMPLSMSSR